MTLAFEALEHHMQRTATLTARIAIGLLLFQALLIMADGLSRWWFATPIHGLEDVTSLIIGVIVASFFPAILIDRRNIRVPIVGRFFGDHVSKILDVFGHFVLLLFVSCIAWQFALYALAVRHQTTLILRLPVAPSLFVIAAILLFCVFVQCFVLLSELRAAVKRNRSRPA